MALDFAALDDISALIQGQDTGKGIRQVKVDAIQPDPNQPRKTFDEAAISELAESIRSVGIIQPPVVRTQDSGFLLISGERRWRAARRLGLERIDVIVRDDLNSRAQLVENIQREALSPWEIYRVIAGELDAGAKQVDLATAFGKSKQWIEAYAAVRKMPDVLVAALRDKRVASITAVGRLHRLYVDRPDVARRMLDSSEPITRSLIAEAMAGCSTQKQAQALVRPPSPSGLPSATAHLDKPVPTQRFGDREAKHKVVVDAAMSTPGEASVSLPIHIHAHYDGASWTVDYRQQRTDSNGARLVLLQGEAGRQCFAPIGSLKLESIECL